MAVIIPYGWRPPFGAAEDRNPATRRWALGPSTTWRPPFGAAEDRNRVPVTRPSRRASWRPPFGAAEDRNTERAKVVNELRALAAALRGGRGSQHS